MLENFNAPNLIHIVDLIKSKVSKRSNILLHSQAGTGKTEVSLAIAKYLKETGYIKEYFFIDAGQSFGVSEAIEHLDKLDMYGNNTLTIIDEGVRITTDSANALRTATNEKNHLFIINTNEIHKISPILRDRFVEIDCTIHKNEKNLLLIEEFVEERYPDLLDKIESKGFEFSDIFEKHFNGSMRSFLEILENNNLSLEPQKTIEEMIQSMNIEQCGKLAFEDWLKHKKGKEVLKEITETIYKASFTSYKDPYKYTLLKTIKE